MSAHVPTLKNSELVRKWTEAVGAKYVRAGNTVQALIDGPETFAAMYQALITAREKGHFIYMLGWYMDDSLSLIDGNPRSSLYWLFKDASPNVQIRVMLWWQLSPSDFKFNARSVKRVNLLASGAAILDRNTPIGPTSHHQKVLIIKGARGLIGFCGGVDVNRDRVQEMQNVEVQSSGPNGSPQHDVHCRVAGPAAHDLLKIFIQRWRAHPGSRTIDQNHGKLLGYSEAPPRANGVIYARVATTFNCVRRRPTSTAGRIGGLPNIDFPRNACKKDRSIAETQLRAIAAASRFIYIEDQYSIDLVAARALHDALPRLTHLTVLLVHPAIVGFPDIRRRHKDFIGTVAFGPKYVEEQERDRKDLSKKPENFNVFYRVMPGTGSLGPHSYIHAKTWIFDDELAVIGSANCNRRGWSSDSEANVLAFDGQAPATSLRSSSEQQFREGLGTLFRRDFPPSLKADPSGSAAPSTADRPSFAQLLRMRLWAEHLGLPLTKVLNGENFSLWLGDQPGSCVRLYDPEQSKDVEAQGPGLVDPDFDDLPDCANGDCGDE